MGSMASRCFSEHHSRRSCGRRVWRCSRSAPTARRSWPRCRACAPSLSSARPAWAVNAYLVVSAAFIMLGGQAADRFGARLASMVGLALFGVASCIIATAGTEAALLAGRALQGLAAAFAAPSTLAAVDTNAPPERRAAAIGAWTGFLMLGFSTGPLLGGALTHVTGWRVIFWLDVPLMLTAIAGLASAGPPTARAHGTRSPRADWIGFVLLATLMVSLVFGLHALPHAKAAPLPVVGPFVLATTAFVLLLTLESRIEAPLVDLSFFARRGFVMGVPIGSLSRFSIMSLLLYFNLYAQSREGLGLTALEAGASLLPLSAALLTLAVSASAVEARVGLRNAMTGDMALIAIPRLDRSCVPRVRRDAFAHAVCGRALRPRDGLDRADRPSFRRRAKHGGRSAIRGDVSPGREAASLPAVCSSPCGRGRRIRRRRARWPSTWARWLSLLCGLDTNDADGKRL